MSKDWFKPYDSPEEAYVSWYLDELVEAGYVARYVHQPKSFILSPKQIYDWRKDLKTKTKWMESTLLQPHVYTPDFEVSWNNGVLLRFIYGNVGRDEPFWHSYDDVGYEATSYIEVKPSFDRNNMTRLFTINQKWMYDKYGIYVQKVIPQKLFEQTFTPKKYLLTDMGKQKRKLIFAPRTLKEYIKTRES